MKNLVSFKSTLLSLSVCAAFASAPAQAFQFKVENTTVDISGFLKLDAMYDTGDIKNNTKGLGGLMLYGNVGTKDKNNNTSGHTTMHANESRLVVRTSTLVEESPLITHFEGDFWGGNFRIRQAYGSYKGFSAGQMWTNFNTFVGSTPVLDFTGPVGRAGVLRQAMVSYNQGPWTIALESPNNDAANNINQNFFVSYDGKSLEVDKDRRNSLPDLTLRYETPFNPMGVNYSFGTLARRITWDNGINESSTAGWGAFAATNFKVTPRTTLRFHGTYGDGIGTYLGNNPAPGAFLHDNKLTSIAAWGGAVGLSQQVGEAGQFNIAYSVAQADLDEAVKQKMPLVGGVDERRQLVHANYMWNVTKNLRYGVEVAWMNKTTVAGEKGDAVRYHASAIYSF